MGSFSLSTFVTCWAVHNTDLPLNSNILKTAREKNIITSTFLKEYFTIILMTLMTMTLALAVLFLDD